MSYVTFLFVLLTTSGVTADLPPGAFVRLGDDRFRTGGSVGHLALAPDGKRYATTHNLGDGFLSLTVWDTATGRPLHEQRVNRELFRGLVWGSGGAFALAARTEPAPKDKRGKVIPDDFRVWDFTDPDAAPPLLPAPELLERVSGSINDAPPKIAEYTGFHFSADGRRVAAEFESAAGKFAVHVFDLKPATAAAKLTHVGTIDLGAEGVDAVRVSASGETVVTFRKLADSDPDREPGAEFVATVWDVARGTPSQPFLIRTSEPFSTAGFPRVGRSSPAANQLLLTPYGRSVIVAAEEERMWGLDEVPLTLPLKNIQPKRRIVMRWTQEFDAKKRVQSDYGGGAFSATGSVLVFAANRKTFVIDADNGKELGRLEGHSRTPSTVAVSADGSTIATADLFGLVRVWDAKTLRPRSVAPNHRAPVEHAELSRDGKRLLTWAPDETVRLWDVATGTELRAFAGASGSHSVYSRCGNRPTFTPDGTAILFSTKERLVSRDLITGLEVPLPGDLAKSAPRYAVFAPDGSSVLTWTDENPSLVVFDWPNGKKRFELDPSDSGQPAGFSPDSAMVFSGTSPRRWDAETGKELAPAWREKLGDNTCALLSLRPSAPIIHAPRSGGVRVLAGASDNLLARFRLQPANDDMYRHTLWGVALAPTGAQLVACRSREAGPVSVHETATGQVRRTLDGHRGDVRVLGFTPDGSKLLTAGGDHTVLVWDMRLQNVPLPDALKNETNAAKLWATLADGNAKDAYLAMARLAREPEAAVKLVKMKLKPATKGDVESDATNLTDARATELLEALDLADARALLKELASGHAEAFRTQEAKRALERLEESGRKK